MIILLPPDGKIGRDRIIAYECREPKLTQHAGRTWERFPIKLSRRHDPEITMWIDAWLDTTWGKYWYFEWQDGKWHRVSVMRNEQHPIRAHRLGHDATQTRELIYVGRT